MQLKPFKNHFQCSTGHLTSNNTIFNADYYFIITIPSMKMCRSMVSKVH